MTQIVPTVVVHGGAGAVEPARLAAHVAGCGTAATIGLDALRTGQSALEAVIRAVVSLEDDDNYNAGTGASLTEEATLELDASVMEGSSLRAGAVAAIPAFRNPIRIAQKVLEDGQHVLYVAEGATRFAEASGFSREDPETMITERARARLARVLGGDTGVGWAGGTVGAVAIDAAGRLAAATSTGGTVAKRIGRVGDTPIIGAGTYADDELGACSTTGIGEAIMRTCLARDVVDRLRDGDTPQQAAETSLSALARRVEGGAGLIVVDRKGQTGVATLTETMSHAVARLGEPVRTGS